MLFCNLNYTDSWNTQLKAELIKPMKLNQRHLLSCRFINREYNSLPAMTHLRRKVFSVPWFCTFCTVCRSRHSEGDLQTIRPRFLLAQTADSAFVSLSRDVSGVGHLSRFRPSILRTWSAAVRRWEFVNIHSFLGVHNVNLTMARLLRTSFLLSTRFSYKTDFDCV
jgi:hypothetical protein